MDSTVKEGWVEWALGMVVFILRITARIKVVGFRWQGDDYLALLAAACYTGVFVTTLIQRPRGSNVGLTDEQRAALTPAQIKPLEEGSKAILAALFVYATGLWAMKGCMLFLYHRLTLGLWQQKMVKWTAAVCAVFYVAIIIVVTCRCVPIKKTWQVYPDPGESCTTSRAYYLTTELSNEITDLLLLSIPLPILYKVNIPIQRKLVIALLLCSGLFVFVVSIIRLVLTLGDISHMTTLAIWAIREMFIAVIAVNAPVIKPLFSTTSWLKTSSQEYSNKRTLGSNSGHVVLEDLPKDQYTISPTGSAEQIISDPPATNHSSAQSASSSQLGMKIQRTTEYEVHHSKWDPVNAEEQGKKW